MRRRALLGCLAAAAYAASFPSAFVMDDETAIVANGVVNGRLPWTDALRRDFWGRRGRDSVGTWRPMVSLMFRAEWALGGGSPRPFHAVNIVLHGVAVTSAAAAFATVAPEAVALGAAGLFAVLCAPSEAVESLSGRADVLLAIFVFAGLIAHVRGRSALAAAALLAALLCKESALVAPLAWFAIGPRERRTPSAAALHGAVLVAAGIARYAALGVLWPAIDPVANPLAAAPALGRVFGAARVFARFTVPGVVDPFRRLYLCSAPACGPAGPDDGLAWIGLVLLAALFAAPVLLWRRRPVAARGLALCALFFAPISNLFVSGPSVYAERLLYVPLAGVALAAAAALVHRRAVLVAIAVVNLVALQRRHFQYRDATTLYPSALAVAPDSALVQHNAAIAAYRLHDAPSAERYARRSLELSPGNPRVESTLAASLDRLGKAAEAERLFAHAFAASGYDVDVATDYARFLLRHGRRTEAADVAQRARLQHPDILMQRP